MTTMFLKNYTSSQSVAKSVSEIETLLAGAGASAIAKNYLHGKLTALTFQLNVDGQDLLIRLPANPNPIFDALAKKVSRPRNGTMDKLRDQAERTAWRIQQEWLEIEITKINLGQTKKLQAFLSYVWDGQRTYFEALEEQKFRGLLPEKAES